MSLKSIINRKNNAIDKLVAEFDRDMAKLNKVAFVQIQALIKAGDIDRIAFSEILTNAGFEDLAEGFVDKYALLFQYSKELSAELGISAAISGEGLSLLEEISNAQLQKILTNKETLLNNMIDAGLKYRVEKKGFRQIVADMQTNIDDIGRRLQAEAQTGMSIFDRSLKAIQADEAGITRFTYVGPNDDKTRDICSVVLNDPQNAKGWTIEEISALPVDQIAGGGYNCRHEFLAVA